MTNVGNLPEDSEHVSLMSAADGIALANHGVQGVAAPIRSDNMQQTHHSTAAILNSTAADQSPEQGHHQQSAANVKGKREDEAADADQHIALEDPPGDFLCGTAISVYQNSGGPDTNWEAFENSRGWPIRHIENGDKCGISNDFWNRFEGDIQRAAALNCRVFRLSMEWGRIEPRQGDVDEAAVKRYHEIFDACDRYGMTTLVTLNHFVHPSWFDRLGHFEKEENIHHFVNFAVTAFRHFGRRTKMWTTFNEGNVQAFCGYVYGSFPPARRMKFNLCGRYLLTLLKAHTDVYDAIKALPGGSKAQVGYVHNWMRYEQKYPVAISAAWTAPVVEIVNDCWANAITLRYLQTGHFSWPKMGWSKGFEWQNPGGRPGCDWLGVNYYGRAMLDWHLAPTARAGETMTDMPYPLYPPGMYQGIAEMSALGVPIWITETGIADRSTLKRPAFFQAYLDQIVKAVEDGYDVRGITMWTLVDNFEWAYGWTMKFGLYGWDHGDPTFKRTLHDTSKVLGNIYKTFPERIRQARESYRTRAAAGNAAPQHVPPPEESAVEYVKHGDVAAALHTHQIGVL